MAQGAITVAVTLRLGNLRPVSIWSRRPEVVLWLQRMSAVRRNATLPPAAVTRVAVGTRLLVRALPRSGTVLSLELLDP